MLRWNDINTINGSSAEIGLLRPRDRQSFPAVLGAHFRVFFRRTGVNKKANITAHNMLSVMNAAVRPQATTIAAKRKGVTADPANPATL